MTALEIVEHDALNLTSGNKLTGRSAITEVFNLLEPSQREDLKVIANHANKLFNSGDIEGAVKAVRSVTDGEEGLALESLLSNDLKKASKALSKERMEVVERVYSGVVDHFNNDDVAGAYEDASGLTDSKEKTALWAKLSKQQKESLNLFRKSIKE